MLHKQYHIDLVMSVNKHFLTIVPTKLEKERMDTSLTEQTVISWNEHVPPDTLQRIKYIRIMDPLETKTSLPLNIEGIIESRAEGISLPVHLVIPFLTTYQHLTMKSLHIMTVEKKEVNFVGEFIFESVKALIISGNGAVLFDRANFPNVSNVNVRIDQKGQMLDAMRMYTNLKALGISPAQKRHAPLTRIAELPLTFFRITNGSLDSLDGLENLASLTNLWIQKLPKLTSIYGLTQLKNLEELTIFYCPKIQDIECLVNIQHLKKLEFFGCGDIGIAKIREKLETMGLEELELRDSA